MNALKRSLFLVSMRPNTPTCCKNGRSHKSNSRLISHRRWYSSSPGSTEAMFDAVITCNEEKLTREIKGQPGAVNARNAQGLTGRMVSSVLGYTNLVEILLKNNCDTALRSPAGLTAVELAAFYRHRDTHALLSKEQSAGQNNDIFFCGNPLNRKSHVRSHPDTMQRYIQSDEARFVLFHRDTWPLVIRTNEHRPSRPGSRPKPKLLKVSYSKVKGVLEEEEILGASVFLGVMEDEETGVSQPHFALDISGVSDHLFRAFHPEAEALIDRRGVFTIAPEEAAIVGQGRCLIDWNERYKFCSTCGSKTVSSDAGYKKKCPNESCLTNSDTYNSTYPRVDPSIISLVISPDNLSCLLARQKRFIQKMYSCLAGFMEPGECIEMCCEREIHEEVGVRVTDVQYVASQPWPMPSVLMVGCTATATTTTINLDTHELEHAQWFSREDVVAMITRTHSEGLFTPPRQAIAHHLIKHWLLKTAF